MKTLILSLLLMSSLIGSAHTFNQSCPSQGRVLFSCSDFSDNGHQYVKIHIGAGLWGNGTADTLFNIAPSYAFNVYVPQPNPNVQVVVTFTNTNSNGSVVGEVHTLTTTPCIVTPLKWGYFNVHFSEDSPGYVDVELMVYDVDLVKDIKINVSTDGGKTRKIIGIINPSNVQENRIYKLKLKY